MTLTEYIDSIATHTDSLRDFNLRYGSEFEQEFEHLLTPSINEDGAALQIYCPQSVREQILAHVGKTLGSSGWTCKPSPYSDGYSWHRAICGVKVTITNAEEKPPEVERPVPPTAFPVLLEDTKSEAI